jgi:predicted acyltransferase
MTAEKASQPNRILSLDQFRGYTVAGMFLVNFIGGFAAVHKVFGHNGNYCSYADTIMPQFFFAVGFAYRLTFLRTREKDGTRAAVSKAIRRNITLFILGAVYYGLDGGGKSWAELCQWGFSGFLAECWRTELFAALTHIAVTSLWILPVIGASARIRILFMAGTALLHFGLCQWFYYDWSLHHGIDGGPMGFMSWAIPTIAGTLAYDWMSADGPRKAIPQLLAWGFGLMIFGYGLSCMNAVNHTLHGTAQAEGIWRWIVEPPFVSPARPSDFWTMSQPQGSLSYHFFMAGFSLALLVVFVVVCDIYGFSLGVFRTLGQNALAAYIICGFPEGFVRPFVPNDAPLWYVMLGFAAFFGITWMFMRYLEKNKLYLRL